MYQYKNQDNYTIALLQKARMYNIDNIIALCEGRTLRNRTALAGRGTLKIFKDHNGRKVVIKPYLRGGALGILNAASYLDVGGKCRAQQELEWLTRMPRLGVNTPEPLFFVKKEGAGIYQCWLGMYYIENAVPFTDIIVADYIKAYYIMPLVCQQVANLILGNILHVDLHPGNVLITNDTDVDIVDFDRAAYFSNKNQKALAEKYIDRWQRACKKHKLPIEIGKSFRQELYDRITQRYTD